MRDKYTSIYNDPKRSNYSKNIDFINYLDNNLNTITDPEQLKALNMFISEKNKQGLFDSPGSERKIEMYRKYFVNNNLTPLFGEKSRKMKKSRKSKYLKNICY